MAENIAFYIEYRNSTEVMLPVNPQKVTLTSGSKNTTETVVSLGDVSLLKLPALTAVSFESFIPKVKEGSYVHPNATVNSAKFYIDLFEAIKKQREAVNLVITGLEISMQVSVEDFEYWWEGSDADMHYSLKFTQYKSFGNTQVSSINQNAPTTNISDHARDNVPKKIAIGGQVTLDGFLSRDSAGKGLLTSLSKTLVTIALIKLGEKYPYYVLDANGNPLGWIAENDLQVIK